MGFRLSHGGNQFFYGTQSDASHGHPVSYQPLRSGTFRVFAFLANERAALLYIPTHECVAVKQPFLQEKIILPILQYTVLQPV